MDNKPIEYLKASDVSDTWKIRINVINQLCEDGKIVGAARFDGKWIIPSDTEKPLIEKITTLARPVASKNKIQEVVLENIEKGHDCHTRELIVDGRTFIVSSVFPKQGGTMEERWTSYMLRKLEEYEDVKLSDKDRKELMLKIRKNSMAANMTFKKYMEYYSMLFQQYGFSDEDVEILLERKSLDYEKFIL